MNKKKWGRLLRIIFGRTAFVTLSIMIQIVILLETFRWLGSYLYYVYGGFVLLSAIVVIYIINKRENPIYQLAWIIPVLVFPVFGAMFYIFLEFQPGTRHMAVRMEKILQKTRPYLQQDEEVLLHLAEESRNTEHLADYMNRYGGYPVYEHTWVEYYPLGDDLYQPFLEELRKAEHYIFLEYFIVERGQVWDSVVEILKEKVQEGVEVRVMYDGMCCLTLLPYRYPQELKRLGIRCKMFSPVKPALSSYQNNRDHRKIAVIDGHTAFTGGINMADEYMNLKERFGHWKDTAIMVKGDGARSFLMMFLQMWNVTEKGEEDFGKYLEIDYSKVPEAAWARGYVMPYGDSPWDREPVGQYVYMDIINKAKEYVHIMTPYLILDSDMMTALTFAAKRGIQVIIIMPHIPDKKYAYLLARSYYMELLLAGVQIFEYTPGFIHAKVFGSDGEKAVVGSINLDYRSMYLHFECAAYLYRNQAVDRVEEDFQKTLGMCREVTVEDQLRYPGAEKVAGSVLRLFAPLM